MAAGGSDRLAENAVEAEKGMVVWVEVAREVA
jgi:hypothetical protein